MNSCFEVQHATVLSRLALAPRLAWGRSRYLTSGGRCEHAKQLGILGDIHGGQPSMAITQRRFCKSIRRLGRLLELFPCCANAQAVGHVADIAPPRCALLKHQCRSFADHRHVA